MKGLEVLGRFTLAAIMVHATVGTQKRVYVTEIMVFVIVGMLNTANVTIIMVTAVVAATLFHVHVMETMATVAMLLVLQ